MFNCNHRYQRDSKHRTAHCPSARRRSLRCGTRFGDLFINVESVAKEKKEASVISVREKEQRELLLLRAQAGDPEALNALFASCRKKLYDRALRILARPQDADDAVQEAMVAAFTHLRRFQGRADFLSWATRIVINAALQQIRKARTKPTIYWDQVDTEFEEGSFSEYLKDPQPTQEERLQQLEHRKMLKDALQTLPREMRRALHLCTFADYSLKEAAHTLGLPLSTLKSHLHRARRVLKLRVKKKTRIRCKPRAEKRPLRPYPASEENLRAA